LAVQQRPVKISRATPPALAAIRVRASSGRSAAVDATVDAIAVVDAQIAEVDVPTTVADVPIVADAPAAADRVSNAAPAAPGKTVVIREAVPVRRAVRSSFPKC